MSKHERTMVPKAEFTSYYGKPVINAPVWAVPDIPGYLFLGGLAGLSSILAAGADLTGRPMLAKAAKLAAVSGGVLSVAALVRDLGRPMRFLNMLRVFKVTSPMSVGSWLLSGYVPIAGVAAASAVTGRFRPIGVLATVGAATLGPAVAAYTATLISDTAVPAWHEGYREMPFVFVGSGATAAGGFGLLAAPVTENGPARNLALLGVGTELAAFARMRARLGMIDEAYDTGKARDYRKAAEALSVLGALGAIAGRRHRIVAALSGAALLAASAATRWGVFHAGMISAKDPKYTITPQRERLAHSR
ncbi:MAG TPA: NrfD/PsrC family molybdoenzyme membrane anchor subunit [Pseudonocardiaceae bacterium]|nr:NrfD/PsrC family molybdoenzyme membrane anchor subunit [Pseudonocardiaceae bacterium]